MAALRVLERCRSEGRWATSEEQAELARWSGWGSIPHIFDEADGKRAAERAELHRLLGSDEAWAAARATTINAHYTSAEVVEAMWRIVADLGFTDGRVLEPGCGSGNFLGFAPDGVEMVGVEMDPTTAAIAQQLYGARATIHNRPFEEFNSPDGVYDLIVGNVPFGKVTPYDRWHNPAGHTLHNYFLVKSLNLTRPGGLVVALTSRYTLDAANPAARRDMASLADLVGAVRLPAKAFAASSGTQVVVDLLVLRRRDDRAEPEGPSWIDAVPAELDDVDQAGDPLLVNEYLAARPENVLGRLGVARGMYREHELTVEATGPLDAQLTEALRRLAAEADERGATFVAASQPVREQRTPSLLDVPAESFEARYAQEGSLVVARSGEIGHFVNGRVTPYSTRIPKEVSELRRLVRLRDAARAVLEVQLRNGGDDELAETQHALVDHYDSYRRIYGPINRFKLSRTGRRDPETGTQIMRRDLPSMGGFRMTDPDWPFVAALEIFDDETKTARQAPIFTERVVAPPTKRMQADSAADALAMCLDEAGTVSLQRVAELLGVDPEDARGRLGELVFDDPASGDLVPAAHYLSGNVRAKLDTARNATEHDGAPRWQANIMALEAALPRQLEPHEIIVRLGTPWVPAEDLEVFCAEVLGVTASVEHMVGLGRWTVAARVGGSRSVALSSEWGTEQASAVTLLEASLNQRLQTVYMQGKGGKRVRDDGETLLAREKQDSLSSRFGDWVWENPARARRLAQLYNERFCSTVLPHHDGSHLSLPGLAANFIPRQHQRDAVARILTDGRALLAHAVGAGKTATMVIAAMELRRLGLARKPAIIVPNHMLEQFSREWLQLYPTARILIADSGQLSKDRRKAFVARCTTGDWDGVVFTHSGFEQIPLGTETLRTYLREELEAARSALAVSKKGKGLSVKKLEAAIARLKQTYTKLVAADVKDDGVRWEETGIDHLMVDEAHLFKNRRIVTSIDGVASKGSQRAQDLDAKLWQLRRSQGVRTATFATATPVANSMAELWVMQSYLQPDVLDETGLRAFDSWAGNFGRTHTALELAPDGASYRMKTRFARFQNVPELLTMFHQVADVRSHDDLKLPTPAVASGKPDSVVVPPSDELRRLLLQLAARADAIQLGRVTPDEDNMLAVTGDGRRAALDLRLVGRPPDPEGGKIAAAARRIAGTYHATREQTYVDMHGQPSPRAGALQLVFCDVSTPAAAGWNAYDELRDQLVRRGVPADDVRYMQHAKTDAAKAKLFAACRDGRVAVLIGSTETMGVGTNVQARAIALHHLDAPWRPADIEQREGRILRQGNQNETVEIIRYVTEGSFDTYMWQTLQRKAEFIAQIASGDLGSREIDDLGEQVLSFAEVKALATGDPRIMEKAAVDADVARLSRLERGHHDEQHRLRYFAKSARESAAGSLELAERYEALQTKVTDTLGDAFTMTVDGQVFTKRTDAGARLVEVLQRRLTETPADTTTEPGPAAHLAGLVIHGQTTTVIENEIRLSVPEIDYEWRLVEHEWSTQDPGGLVQRLERRIQRIPETIDRLRADAAASTTEAEQADARLGQPWEHADQLARLRRRQQELDEELTISGSAPPPDRSTPDDAGAAAILDDPVAYLDRVATKAVVTGEISL